MDYKKLSDSSLNCTSLEYHQFDTLLTLAAEEKKKDGICTFY